MSGHCQKCGRFSLQLRSVKLVPSECLPAGYIVDAWRADLCVACELMLCPIPQGTIGAQPEPQPSDKSTT